MELFDRLAKMGHEEVVVASDPSCGYRGIVAVHSTALGPALGGHEACPDPLAAKTHLSRTSSLSRRPGPDRLNRREAGYSTNWPIRSGTAASARAIAVDSGMSSAW